MRLSDREREILRETAQGCFEPDVVLRLFGSRLDDSRRGGDVDLLVETRIADAASVARAHLRFLSKVNSLLGEQRIDVLIDYPGRRQRSHIFEIARVQGVVL